MRHPPGWADHILFTGRRVDTTGINRTTGLVNQGSDAGPARREGALAVKGEGLPFPDLAGGRRRRKSQSGTLHAAAKVPFWRGALPGVRRGRFDVEVPAATLS